MRKGSEILVSLIDELLAVWEGKPARGYCGTADVVAYPTRQGIPVRIVGPKEPAVALFVSAGCARTGTGRPSQSETSGNRPLDGGGFAAFSACCKRGQSLLPGPRPPKDSAKPQMVILSYGNTGAGVVDPGAAVDQAVHRCRSGQPLTLDDRPLGKRD
ncbi:hypothetical protein ABZS59_30420 [Streptomyces flaveolus]|uniref:hypothetical protein n=1 Tax=Streptomyces flaveolus TaxID=67297 RepID=UPI0033BEF083